MSEKMDFDSLRLEIREALHQLLEKANLENGGLFVLGCSSSEIQGFRIGQKGNLAIGYAVVATLLEELRPRGIELAVQCCEHLNRALVVERKTAQRRHLECVSAVPHPKAGGSAASSAWALFDEPVLVAALAADCGMDIGDVSIGMQIKRVQIPIRLARKSIGKAHLACLSSRPPLIGGERARYSFSQEEFEALLAADSSD